MKFALLIHAVSELNDRVLITLNIGEVCPHNTIIQDKTVYSSNAFRKYNFTKARFGENGWCTKNGEEEYLLIDLEKEYQITRVVTMGDRDLQKKWIGMFTFTYSPNRKFENKEEKVP